MKDITFNERSYDYRKHYKIRHCNTKSNFQRNYDKYNLPLLDIEKVKQVMNPYYNNSFPYYSPITDKVNTWIIKFKDYNNIYHNELFSCAKTMNKRINSIIHNTNNIICFRLFLIPEMNIQFTKRQISYYIFKIKVQSEIRKILFKEKETLTYVKTRKANTT